MVQRCVLLLAALFALSACGGGGGGTSSGPKPVATTGTSTSQQPVATGTLTITFPQTFHTASATAAKRGFPASTLVKTAAATTHKPAYVNPNTLYLDVWVVNTSAGNSITHVVDSSGGANVNGGNGVQTLSVPLFSTNANDVVAIESTQAYPSIGTIVAIGEADVGSITAGASPALSLTMLMNATNIGVMSDPNDGNNDATTASTYTAVNGMCALGAQSGSLYFFATDPLGGFVTGGVGGVPSVTLGNGVSDVTGPANTLGQTPGVNGAPYVTFNNIGGGTAGMTLSLSAANPAYAIGYDAVNRNALYPGVDLMYVNGYYQPQLYSVFTVQNVTKTIDVRPNLNCTQTFNYTGSTQNFVVPAGVTSIVMSAAGAAGAGACCGDGGIATGTFPVTPGETLYVNAGGVPSGGTGGWNGGGNSGGDGCNSAGGGASDVQQGGSGLAFRILVGGGGGGGGCDNGQGGGNGGYGGQNTGNGGSVGSAGGGGGGLGASVSAGGAGGGGGAGQGGSNGTGGAAGSLGFGGAGGAGGASACTGLGGSGGGGGYYGGGGGGGGGSNGACTGGYGGAGGGGGSSYVGPTNTSSTFADNANSGNGYVVMQYVF